MLKFCGKKHVFNENVAPVVGINLGTNPYYSDDCTTNITTPGDLQCLRREFPTNFRIKVKKDKTKTKIASFIGVGLGPILINPDSQTYMHWHLFDKFKHAKIEYNEDGTILTGIPK